MKNLKSHNNVTIQILILAEREGFEPSDGVNRHTISSRTQHFYYASHYSSCYYGDKSSKLLNKFKATDGAVAFFYKYHNFVTILLTIISSFSFPDSEILLVSEFVKYSEYLQKSSFRILAISYKPSLNSIASLCFSSKLILHSPFLICIFSNPQINYIPNNCS